jgi:putative ABC transport system permease protein
MQHGKRGAQLRKGLVAFQFAVAVALIAATGVVYQQLRFVQQKDLGFAKDQVVTVPIYDVREQYPAVKRAFAQHTGVVSASATSGAPGSYRMTYGFEGGGVGAENAKDLSAKIVFADTDYRRTMEIPLVAGRFFSEERAVDSTAYVLNESAVRELGWQHAVGRTFSYAKRDGDGAPGPVIGVLEDFHFASLREEISPVVIRIKRPPYESYASYGQIAVRFRPGQTEAVLGHLETAWAQFSEEPLDYTFLDEQFAEMYRTERRLGQVFTAFAMVAVLIACLGLFGLAAFAAERRSKEIAIRKAVGASARQIVALLSKEFLVLVAVGFAVAVPAAWLAMGRWLEDFAYRIELSPLLFAAAGLAALVVALGATGWQALRAARANPADALRDE